MNGALLGYRTRIALLLSVCGLLWLGAASASYGETAAADDFGVISHLTQRDYGSLETRYGDLVKRYKSGLIGDEAVHDALDSLAQNTNDGQEAFFDGWVEQYPKSYVALTARGYYLRAKAGRIRGGRYSRDTTSEQFEGFRDYMLKARADLEKSLALDDKPTASYLRLITIAGSLDGPDAARKLRDLALGVDPQSYVAHRIYLLYVTPKWGGRLDLMITARTDALSSRMSDKDKGRYRAVYDFLFADEMERLDKANDALTYYWRSYQEGAENEGHRALERGASLANRIRRFDEAMKFLDEMISVHRGNEVWARDTRGHIHEAQLNQLEKAFNDYSAAAAMGDTWAENKLGVWYYNGTYVARDPDMAKKYWQRAADKGNQTAVGNLKRFDRKTDQAGKE